MGSYQLIREKNEVPRLRWDPQQVGENNVEMQGEVKNFCSPNRIIDVITNDGQKENNDLELIALTSPNLTTLPKSSADCVGHHFRTKPKIGSSTTSSGSASGRLLSLDIFRGITVAVIFSFYPLLFF